MIKLNQHRISIYLEIGLRVLVKSSEFYQHRISISLEIGLRVLVKSSESLQCMKYLFVLNRRFYSSK